MDTQERKKLRLFEALELRSEYDSRIKTLKECCPENRKSRGYLYSRSEESINRPSPGFDPLETRKQIKSLETKRLKINRAIQEVNFSISCEFMGENLKLGEALERRKSLNERIGELHTQVVESAHERVIYKEGRDIVDRAEISYVDASQLLNDCRIEFRKLNQMLRQATFETTVDYFED